jgi:hypothetical protein
MILFGAVIAYRVRAVPSDFNEAFYIMQCLGFIVVYSCLILPLQVLVNDRPEVLFVLFSTFAFLFRVLPLSSIFLRLWL